jgi:hypothetical protein
MAAVSPDLVESDTGLLPEFDRLTDRRMPQRVAPTVDADLLAECTDDAQN